MFKQKLNVKKLDIFNLLGVVTIKSHAGNEVEILTTEEEKVDITQSGSTLRITSKVEESTSSKKNIFKSIFGGVSITNQGNNSTIIIGNGNVVSGGNIVNGISEEQLANVRMSILVPENLFKSISISGKVRVSITGISNKLSVDNSGQTSVSIHGIDEVDTDTSGQSSADIFGARIIKADVSGQSRMHVISDQIKEIELDASGQSQLNVESKQVDELEADLSGMSQLIVKGSVARKDIDKSGMANAKFV